MNSRTLTACQLMIVSSFPNPALLVPIGPVDGVILMLNKKIFWLTLFLRISINSPKLLRDLGTIQSFNYPKPPWFVQPLPFWFLFVPLTLVATFGIVYLGAEFEAWFIRKKIPQLKQLIEGRK